MWLLFGAFHPFPFKVIIHSAASQSAPGEREARASTRPGPGTEHLAQMALWALAGRKHWRSICWERYFKVQELLRSWEIGRDRSSKWPREPHLPRSKGHGAAGLCLHRLPPIYWSEQVSTASRPVSVASAELSITFFLHKKSSIKCVNCLTHKSYGCF